MRPVLPSTSMLPLMRESGKSVKSIKIKGLFGSAVWFWADVVAFEGKVIRYKAVWFVTVISVCTEVFKLTAKYPG